MSEPACWHREIDDEGICKACGAKAAIKLEGMRAVPVKGRGSVGLHSHGQLEGEVAEETSQRAALSDSGKLRGADWRWASARWRRRELAPQLVPCGT